MLTGRLDIQRVYICAAFDALLFHFGALLGVVFLGVFLDHGFPESLFDTVSYYKTMYIYYCIDFDELRGQVVWFYVMAISTIPASVSGRVNVE